MNVAFSSQSRRRPPQLLSAVQHIQHELNLRNTRYQSPSTTKWVHGMSCNGCREPQNRAICQSNDRYAYRRSIKMNPRDETRSCRHEHTQSAWWSPSNTFRWYLHQLLQQVCCCFQRKMLEKPMPKLLLAEALPHTIGMISANKNWRWFIFYTEILSRKSSLIRSGWLYVQNRNLRFELMREESRRCFRQKEMGRFTNYSN